MYVCRVLEQQTHTHTQYTSNNSRNELKLRNKNEQQSYHNRIVIHEKCVLAVVYLKHFAFYSSTCSSTSTIFDFALFWCAPNWIV